MVSGPNIDDPENAKISSDEGPHGARQEEPHSQLLEQDQKTYKLALRRVSTQIGTLSLNHS